MRVCSIATSFYCRELMLVDFHALASVVCRPLLDILWQAAGFRECGDYDATGVWIGDKP